MQSSNITTISWLVLLQFRKLILSIRSHRHMGLDCPFNLTNLPVDFFQLLGLYLFESLFSALFLFLLNVADILAYGQLLVKLFISLLHLFLKILLILMQKFPSLGSYLWLCLFLIDNLPSQQYRLCFILNTLFNFFFLPELVHLLGILQKF